MGFGMGEKAKGKGAQGLRSAALEAEGKGFGGESMEHGAKSTALQVAKGLLAHQR